MIIEVKIKKKKGEDLTEDTYNLISTRLNGDRDFMALLQYPSPMQGVTDDGKPYTLLVGEKVAIVYLRQDDKNVTVSFIKGYGIKDIDREIRTRYNIYAFRGRTSPYEYNIKQHLLSLIAEDDEDKPKENPDIEDARDTPDKRTKKDKKDKRDKPTVEDEDTVYHELFKM